MNGYHLLLVCATENKIGSRVSRYFDITSVSLNYMTYDMRIGLLVSSFAILREETAGIGIDIQAGIMYRLKESSFGELEIHHLLNGKKRVEKGLFLQNFLDAL